ncbi:MAG: hypothetical protein RLN60_02700 [Phycisphaerales bacterium]
MFIDQLTNADALPTLGAMAQFSARRQAVLQHNIANISTPNFQPKTVSVDDFRVSLRDAVTSRRKQFGGHRGDLSIRDTREAAWTSSKAGERLVLNPTTPSNNILFHDRNNRDLERMMQDLAENVAAFRVATELMKSNMETLGIAIREQP